MLYGYDIYYPPTDYAQPQANPYFIHPNLVAAQLGLTQEEAREAVEEQERWFREEYQQWLDLGEYRTPAAGSTPGRSEVGTHPLYPKF